MINVTLYAPNRVPTPAAWQNDVSRALLYGLANRLSSPLITTVLFHLLLFFLFSLSFHFILKRVTIQNKPPTFWWNQAMFRGILIYCSFIYYPSKAPGDLSACSGLPQYSGPQVIAYLTPPVAYAPASLSLHPWCHCCLGKQFTVHCAIWDTTLNSICELCD